MLIFWNKSHTLSFSINWADWIETLADLELWGGHECTVNRVGAVFYDQTLRSGHQDRLEDLDRFAALGLDALRYPLLWERIAPDSLNTFDWSWTDVRLARLSEHNIRPIAGLLHHGSGPAYTNLLDDDFAPKLARFAGAVAKRYDHVLDWTPINEPLTTARFSALYGHWYPHQSDERSFWLALLNQIDGVRLTMRAVREVNPEARLIQTEDLGRTYSTRAASHQATFDNQRRWMTWDLLFGRVTRIHPLWDRMSRFGYERRLQAIANDPCPPNVVGVNHYLTSDRFLDHQCEGYPPARCGGHGFTRFADVEAVRVLTPQPQGLAGALDEAWERYGTTLAVTESQLGCSRENQMRWISEAWRTAQSLRARGVQIEAVTAWALLGAYDWNSLLMQKADYYESGAFDVRGPEPRATAVAGLVKRLRQASAPHHDAEAGLGWWRRDVRLTYRPVSHAVQAPSPARDYSSSRPVGRPILVTGASSVLALALGRQCAWRDLDYVLTDLAVPDLTDGAAFERALDHIEPWAVINTAGSSDVDKAEGDPARCFAFNYDLPVDLARACAARNLPFVNFSSSLVFDGRKDGVYLETDTSAPLSVYGEAKARADQVILDLGGRTLVIRTSALFSPFDDRNFAAEVVRKLIQGMTIMAASDLILSPTYTPSLIDSVLDLLIDGETGLWHLANQGAVSYSEFARKIASELDLDASQIREVCRRDLPSHAAQPPYSALGSIRGKLLPSLSDGIGRFAYVMRESDFQAEPARPAPQSRARPARTFRTLASN